MFRHVVLLRWKPDMPAAALERAMEALAELKAATTSALDYRYGADAEVDAGNWDFAVVADFASEADYIEFRDDEAHRSMVSEVIVPWRAERAAIQLQY